MIFLFVTKKISWLAFGIHDKHVSHLITIEYPNSGRLNEFNKIKHITIENTKTKPYFTKITVIN